MSTIAEIGVRITADASRLMSGLQGALDRIDRFANQVDRAAKKVGMMGAAITAVGAKLVADASKYDAGVKQAVTGLGDAYSALAVRLGRALIPAVEQLTDFVTRLVRAWDALSPSQRQAITDFAELAAKALLVVAVGGQVVGMIGNFAGLAAVLLPVIPTLAAIAGGVMLLAGLAAIFYKAWNDNAVNVQTALTRAFEVAKSVVLDWVDSNLRGVEVVLSVVNRLQTAWVGYMRMMVNGMAALDRLLPKAMQMPGLYSAANKGLDVLEMAIAPASLDDARKKLEAIGKSVGGAVSEGLTTAVDYGIQAVQEAVAKLEPSVRAALKAAGLDKLLGAFSGPAGGPPGHTKTLEEQSAFRKLLESIRVSAATPERYRKNRIGFGGTAVSSSVGGGYVGDGPSFLQRATARWTKVGIELESSGRSVAASINFAAARFTASFRDSMFGAGQSILQAAMSAAPKFGAMMQGAMQGLQSGGPWGALAGAIASLLTQTQAFAALMEQLEAGTSTLVSILEPVLKPLLQLNIVANALLGVLARVVTPVLNELGKGLFTVFRVVGLGVLDVIIGLKDFWNGIVLSVRDFLYNVGDLFKDAFPALRDAFYNAAVSVGRITASTKGLQDVRDELARATWENIGKTTTQTEVIAGNTEQQQEHAKAIRDATEALTNLPSGYKVAAARFAAMSASDGGGQSASSIPLRTNGGGSATVNVYGNVYGVDDLVQIMNQAQQRRAFRMSGLPLGG